MRNLISEFRQSVRALLRSPGFTLPSVGVLALGLGLNLAVLSYLDQLVLRPFPFRESGRLALLETEDSRTR